MNQTTTRRAVLTGIAALTASALPTIAPAGAIAGPTSDDPLVALAARSAEIQVARRWHYRRHVIFSTAKDPELLRELFEGPLAHCSAEERANFVRNAAAYWAKGGIDGEEDFYDESRGIENELRRTPARTLDGLLAKLRWLVDNMSDDAEPELPTLATAYDWHGSGGIDGVLASAWADAERLIGGAA